MRDEGNSPVTLVFVQRAGSDDVYTSGDELLNLPLRDALALAAECDLLKIYVGEAGQAQGRGAIYLASTATAIHDLDCVITELTIDWEHATLQ